MASEQFSLCWDNFHKNMSSGMNSLLESEDLVDVTLAVEGKYLKAHKMVLSVCSPYFRDLFKINPCKHPIVFMKDVSYVAMSDLLQFMYQGEVQVSQENLTTFIKTAEALQIKGLTGDGNGSAECDNDQDDSKSTEIETPKLPPTTTQHKVKKVHQPAAPPASKRPRLSVPETSTPTLTKTEHPVAQVSSATTSNELVQFKMEPYDQGQSAVTVPDDNPDETFNEDPLDETNADDGTEDYSMMEGGDEEPQAGTSADGAAGEGQVIETASSCILTEIAKIRANLNNIEMSVKSLSLPKIGMNLFCNERGIQGDHQEFDNLFQFPIDSVDELNRLDLTLIKNENYCNYFKMKFINELGSDGKKDGNKQGRKFINIVFSPKILTYYSWTGNTRAGEKKNSFCALQGIISAFTSIMKQADWKWDASLTEIFFKMKILKFSVKRKQSLELKLSKESRRDERYLDIILERHFAAPEEDPLAEENSNT